MRISDWSSDVCSSDLREGRIALCSSLTSQVFPRGVRHMPTPSHLAANWSDIRRRVDEACGAAGRDPAEVSILPVSKTFGPELIREGVALGMRRFGENKVQAIRDKSTPLAECGQIGRETSRERVCQDV